MKKIIFLIVVVFMTASCGVKGVKKEVRKEVGRKVEVRWMRGETEATFKETYDAAKIVCDDMKRGMFTSVIGKFQFPGHEEKTPYALIITNDSKDGTLFTLLRKNRER